MLLHAEKLTSEERLKWVVFHVPTCKMLRSVYWVNDETAQWCQYSAAAWTRHTHQAKKIVIMPEYFLVLIDPVDGCTNLSEDTKHELDLANVRS